MASISHHFPCLRSACKRDAAAAAADGDGGENLLPALSAWVTSVLGDGADQGSILPPQANQGRQAQFRIAKHSRCSRVHSHSKGIWVARVSRRESGEEKMTEKTLVKPDDTCLPFYYLTRTAFSISWLATTLALNDCSSGVVAALLLLHPAWDAAANIVDAQRNGGPKRNVTQTLNAVAGAATTAAVAITVTMSMTAAHNRLSRASCSSSGHRDLSRLASSPWLPTPRSVPSTSSSPAYGWPCRPARRRRDRNSKSQLNPAR
jgi:hypothetical protein